MSKCNDKNPSPSRGEVRRGASQAHRYPLANILENARQLRETMTDAENLVWYLLRRKQVGVKFRKQHPLGQYIADFACLDPKVIIELDGSQHNEKKNKIYDKKRDEFFKKQGFKVLRFWNIDILKQTDAIMETIYNEIHGVNRPHPSPPPNWEGIKIVEAKRA